MPKMTEEQRQRRAAMRARREALAAEEDELRLEQRRQQWIDQGAYLTRAELEAGEPCRGCGGPILDGLGSWPAMMHMTPDERRDYDLAETLYRERHGACNSHRWSMGGHRATHCGYCCPSPPLSERQIEDLRQIFSASKTQKKDLDDWDLTLTCDHVVRCIQHRDHDRCSARVAHCPACGLRRGIVDTHRIGPTEDPEGRVRKERVATELQSAKAKLERQLRAVAVTERRISDLMSQMRGPDLSGSCSRRLVRNSRTRAARCSGCTEHRTPGAVTLVLVALEESDTAEIFAELVGDLGLPVVEGGQPDEPDVVLIDTDGRHVLVQLKRLSTPTPTQVSRLVADGERRGHPGALYVLVADRIPEVVRAELRSRGWGWLDLRGHVHLAGHGVFVDADVPPVKGRADRKDAFSGSAGLEVACAFLLEPDVRHGVRDLARRIGRSPSTVSEVLHAFRRQGLVGSDGVAVLPDLFWETVSAWRPRDVPLADLPRPGTGSVNAALQLGFDDVEAQPGWALTGTLAAAVYGAPVAARSDYPPEFYVPTPAILRRATRLLGVPIDADHRRASVRVAPVSAVCEQRVDPAGLQARAWALTNESWPLAHPLFVALDLAHDPGRGREILEGWQPPQPWRRVW